MRSQTPIPAQARDNARGNEVARLKLAIRGAVQGVGFRPFVYRLAHELKLAGWVGNSAQGVGVEVEGPRPALEQFLLRLEAGKPPRSSIQSLEASWLDAAGHQGFTIRESEVAGSKTALVLPDIATCPECLREILDPANRRYRYPFTNCTHCGPRYSIIEALPYDRANTTMRSFQMCPACQAEYDDPRDRRFHAQPNACPVCGPRLELWGPAGVRLSECDKALRAAADAIGQGKIIAVKGLGGFHLMVDARNDTAVRRLRARKHREEKPLALMFPTLESVMAVCEVSPLEGRLLRSPEAPIVLLKRLNHRLPPGPLPQEREICSRPHDGFGAASKSKVEEQLAAVKRCSLSPAERVRVRTGAEPIDREIAVSVAPGNPNLGVLLPSNPLHHLLLAELGFPIVATSGNLSDEPICTDEHEARERLGDIADAFLVHNRPIVRHVDDSIVRVMLDREMVLRRARGYAPLPVVLKCEMRNAKSEIVLAVGAHLKNAVALALGDQVFLSQHIGDLETEQANRAFRRVVADLQKLYEAKPEIVVADLHPDYLSTRFADDLTGRSGKPLPAAGAQRIAPPARIGVQHHIAHVLSCMGENELKPPVLGVAWDGTGYGTDGTIWGGEFFRVTQESVERVAHWRPFRLPGGDAAVKEPRRAALGLLYEMGAGDDRLWSHLGQRSAAWFSATEMAALTGMLAREVNSPWCCSVGRLFDAVASLVGLRQTVRFEGQAAMELEFALEGVETDEAYPVRLENCERQTAASAVGKSEVQGPGARMVLDWSPMIEAIIADVARDLPAGAVSARFHNALVEAIVALAKRLGEVRIALSGGCFQNRYLTERTVKRLRAEGLRPYWHQRVPSNDGGISLGQIIAARRVTR